MTTADLLTRVASIISGGATLRTPTHYVGPFDAGTDAASTELRFACFDRTGTIVDAWEEWDEAQSHHEKDRRGWGAQFVTQRRRDWSAFGAARAFVDAHRGREHEIHIAFRRLERARRGAFKELPAVEVYRVRPRGKVGA